MNPDWVSIPNDTSNSIRSCLHEKLSWGSKDHVEWKSHSGLKLVSDSCTDNLIFPAILALIQLNTRIKLLILQTIFLGIIKVDFILSLIQEWMNFDPSLHDSESTFHSRSSVQTGMKNEINFIGNKLHSLPLNRDSCKQIQFNPLWSQQKQNEFDPAWNLIRIHVNIP